MAAYGQCHFCNASVRFREGLRRHDSARVLDSWRLYDQSATVGRRARARVCGGLTRDGPGTSRRRDESRSSTGSAFIVRGTETIPAKAGELVYAADGIRTGDAGSVGVTLKDDTRLSLGPNSEVRLERYVYAPGQRRPRHGPEVRPRHGCVRLRTHREARARLHPSRNARGHRRRARHGARDSRRGAITTGRCAASDRSRLPWRCAAALGVRVRSQACRDGAAASAASAACRWSSCCRTPTARSGVSACRTSSARST